MAVPRFLPDCHSHCRRIDQITLSLKDLTLFFHICSGSVQESFRGGDPVQNELSWNLNLSDSESGVGRKNILSTTGLVSVDFKMGTSMFCCSVESICHRKPPLWSTEERSFPYLHLSHIQELISISHPLDTLNQHEINETKNSHTTPSHLVLHNGRHVFNK